jgi:hypothetical protein
VYTGKSAQASRQATPHAFGQQHRLHWAGRSSQRDPDAEPSEHCSYFA